MEFIAFFLILGSIFWLIKKTPRKHLPDTELRLLAQDRSQRVSYNPDWVLRHLLLDHPQFFSRNIINKVLADCAPHDEEVYEPTFSFTWVWVVELLRRPDIEEDCRYAYVVGWFDPRLWEPVSHLFAWFFPTPEEAAAGALTSLDTEKGKTKPDQKLYKFLKSQLEKGEKVERNPHGH
jgi:hypothetical protein